MNTDLLEKLAKLADELDNNGSTKLADDVGALMKEIVEELDLRSKNEEADMEANLTICPKCDGEGGTADEPFCSSCRGAGFITLGSVDKSLIKLSFIKKLKGKWCVVSKKGKSLGCYGSRKAALKRLRQVEFFKHNK